MHHSELSRQEDALFEMLRDRFQDRVHLSGTTWFSRDPETGYWENDRMWGRRFEIMSQLYRERRDTEQGTWQMFRWLRERQGQYRVLNVYVGQFRALPAPEGLRH